MVRSTADAPASPEPLPLAIADHPVSPRAVRRIGRLRVPLGLHHAPWATLYRMPDGRLLWAIRLWEVDRPVRRLVPTATLRRFGAVERLPTFLAEVEALVAAAGADAGR